jgi:HD superfamily phosphohydrolase
VEIRDPIHGSIHIDDSEIPIIEHPFFQRLRNIKQLGFSEYSFPGATHTRYIHSIGVMHVSTIVFDKLFSKTDNELLRLRQTLKMACLLHDIGHAPLSHSTEIVMPQVSRLKLPKRFQIDNPELQATHEDYTIKAIADSSFTDSFKQIEDKFGVNANAIAELVIGHTTDPDYFTINGVNYFPILHQLVSSEIDCDRMDYLLRDSYFCGVSYGQYDLDWLTDNIVKCPINNRIHLGISDKALSTFDDFLLSRFHMFLMVYFHYRAVCLEQMLLRYFKTQQHEYEIPADIEEYQQHDDHYLSKILRTSKNKWAQMIVKNVIPPKIFECFGDGDRDQLDVLESFLKQNNIDYIKCSSRGRLSKYYDSNKPDSNFPIFVEKIKSNLLRNPIYSDIHQATELFEKYSKSHSVVRIHCDYKELPNNQRKQLIDILS